jgi:hypothetical protein
VTILYTLPKILGISTLLIPLTISSSNFTVLTILIQILTILTGVSTTILISSIHRVSLQFQFRLFQNSQIGVKIKATEVFVTTIKYLIEIDEIYEYLSQKLE